MAHAFVWIVIFIALKIDMIIIACNVTLNFTYGEDFELIPFKDLGNRSILTLHLSNYETEVYIGLGADAQNLSAVAFEVTLNHYDDRQCYIGENNSPAICSFTSFWLKWTSIEFLLGNNENVLLNYTPSTIASVLFKNTEQSPHKSIQVWFDAPLADYCCALGKEVIDSCKCTNATCKSENQPNVTVPIILTTNAFVTDSRSSNAEGQDSTVETTSRALSTHQHFTDNWTTSEHTFVTTEFTTRASIDFTETSSPSSYENISPSTTAELSSEGSGLSTSSPLNLCACKCNRVKAPASPNEIAKKMLDTSANLLLAKKNLSSYTRRLKSAEDDRVSSKTMGLLGVSFIASVILIIIMSDVIRLIKYITRS